MNNKNNVTTNIAHRTNLTRTFDVYLREYILQVILIEGFSSILCTIQSIFREKPHFTSVSTFFLFVTKYLK